MYKLGGVLDFLNKDKNVEDSQIGDLFKKESKISKLLHSSSERPSLEHNRNPLIEEDEDDDVEEELNITGHLSRQEMRMRMKSKKMQDKRTVFVGNVPLDATKKDLEKLFRGCGEVASIRFRSIPSSDIKLPKRAVAIKKACHKDAASMNAYVVFNQQQDVVKALHINNTQLLGRHLRVDLLSQCANIPHDRSVFIGNLPFDAEDEEVRSMMSSCGEVIKVRLPRHRSTNTCKGVAFVTFQEKSSASEALTRDFVLRKRKLRLEMSCEQKEDNKTKSTSTKKDLNFRQDKKNNKNINKDNKGEGKKAGKIKINKKFTKEDGLKVKKGNKIKYTPIMNNKEDFLKKKNERVAKNKMKMKKNKQKMMMKKKKKAGEILSKAYK